MSRVKTFSIIAVVAVGALLGAALTAWCLWTAFRSNLLDFLMAPAFVWLIPIAAVAGGLLTLRTLQAERKTGWTGLCLLSVTLPLAFVAWASHLDLDDSLCENQTLQNVKSPDGRYSALVFTRDCGAVGDNNTMVVVYPTADGFPKNPDRWDEYAIYNSDEQPNLHVRWGGPRHLVVNAVESRAGDGYVYLERHSCGTIAVSYQGTEAVGK